MQYLITKKDLKEALMDKLIEEVRGKYFSFFTDKMNRVFVEQTQAFSRNLFFEIIKDLKNSEAIYFLEDNEIYEKAFEKVLEEIIKEFKNKKCFIKKIEPWEEEDPFK